MSDRDTLGMAAIGGTVALATAVAPRTFLKLFGTQAGDAGAGDLGWRLFAIRTAAISVMAARGDASAQRLFLPVQIADQAAWWLGYRRGELSLRTAATAAAASVAIIALDVRRRTAGR